MNHWRSNKKEKSNDSKISYNMFCGNCIFNNKYFWRQQISLCVQFSNISICLYVLNRKIQQNETALNSDFGLINRSLNFVFGLLMPNIDFCSTLIDPLHWCGSNFDFRLSFNLGLALSLCPALYKAIFQSVLALFLTEQ